MPSWLGSVLHFCTETKWPWIFHIYWQPPLALINSLVPAQYHAVHFLGSSLSGWLFFPLFEFQLNFSVFSWLVEIYESMTLFYLQVNYVVCCLLLLLTEKKIQPHFNLLIANCFSRIQLWICWYVCLRILWIFAVRVYTMANQRNLLCFVLNSK